VDEEKREEREVVGRWAEGQFIKKWVRKPECTKSTRFG
jgi:hypothetical protein